MPTDGRRAVHALFLVAIVGVLMSTAWVTFWAGFTLESSGWGPVQQRQVILSMGIGCGLLVATAVALRLLQTDRWLVVVDATLAALVALLTIFWASSPARGQDSVDGNPWGWVIWMWAVTPTTWPVLLVLLGTVVVRGRSRLERRSRPDR